jgi:FkbM family methyltransferase
VTSELQRQHPIAHEALRILKYSYRFGPLRGPLTWARFKLSRDVVAVRLPQYPAPIYVRPGTSDVWTFEKIFISREYDLSLLQRPLTPRTIIDVGANVGYASVFFARQFPTARIVAIEPQEANFALLQRNTAAYPNVTAVRAALWPRPGSLTIQNPEEDAWAFRVGETRSSKSETVRGISMPEIMSEHGVSTIDLLKIDIEGAEKEVFEDGSESWLAKTGVLVIELHDWMRDGCATAFYRATSKFPFRHYTSGENTILARVE